MGIPLPALSIHPPEQQDLLGQYGKIMQLKSLMGGQQLQGLQTQEAQINLENARQQQLENKTLRDSYRNNGGDLEQTIKDAAASGNVSPGTLTKLQETQLKIQTDLATKDEKVLKNALDSGNLFAGALDAVKQVPIENRQQAVKTQLARLASQGVDVSSVAKTVQGLPDLSDDTLDGVEASLLGHNKAVEQEMKRREVTAQETSANARKTQANKPPQPTEASLAVASVGGDKNAEAALQRLDKSKLASKPPKDTTGRDDARSDKSYQFNSGQLDKVGKPVEDAVARLGRLRDTLAQGTPQADALVAPELLTVMAGGAGSGLRMNEAEISRVIGGRSKWESLKAAANQWSLDPKTANSITPEQRSQIHALVEHVNNKLLAKQQLMDQARQDLIGTDDPGEHRRIVATTRSKLTKIDEGEGQQTQLPNGGGKAIDKATAQQFYEAAGHDPDKARKLAVQNGWKVQ